MIVSIGYLPTNCVAKNGTFATLQMLQNQTVDVIFGPICARGKPDYNYRSRQWSRYSSRFDVCVCVCVSTMLTTCCLDISYVGLV